MQYLFTILVTIGLLLVPQQPTGRLTTIVTYYDLFGVERGVGEGYIIQVYNDQGFVSEAKTNNYSSYTFELPYDTYLVIALVNDELSPYFRYVCNIPRIVLSSEQDYALIRCYLKFLLHLPFLSDNE